MVSEKTIVVDVVNDFSNKIDSSSARIVVMDMDSMDFCDDSLMANPPHEDSSLLLLGEKAIKRHFQDFIQPDKVGYFQELTSPW
uniref:Uncharacterized protein n=1 Tax=Nelumbo nucifera TaxID=4432 RepID=A0A822YEE8_NELNU|nr:TPA_asm: hypothetical protein HUJ06_011395 [Nelumbo nucifera]